MQFMYRKHSPFYSSSKGLPYLRDSRFIETFEIMKPLSVFLIQANLKWMDIDANLEAFEEKIRSLKGNTDLIILPEMFTTGFTNRSEKVAEPVNGKTYKW